MKYIVVLGDGMADYPVESLNNMTPLQKANKPTIDALVKEGEIGLAKTVPEDMPPGSDTANLSVLGYNPAKYYSGRSPFEAVSMGIELEDSDVSFRCNLVTLSEEENYQESTMLDHSADGISSSEASQLIEMINQKYASDTIKFYPGISYRHLMVWKNAPTDWVLTPPHDIINKRIEPFLPQGEKALLLNKIMADSSPLLEEHQVNKKRKEKGQNPANSLWLWGEGKKPKLDSFQEKYNLKGSVISAVDLVKGIALYLGLDQVEVEGATGEIDTNYQGKVQAALDALLKKEQDFVFIHIEAPDECGHKNEVNEKVKAIELIDQKVVRVLKEELDRAGEDYRMMVLPDHATPLALRTHTRDPIPFVIYDSTNKKQNTLSKYDEDTAKSTGLYFPQGYKLMEYFINTK